MSAETIGHYLRSERERCALSLEELSNTTRIPRKALVSLEEDRFDDLPGDVFVRGFLRAYASALEVDPNALVARFDSDRPRARRPAPLSSVGTSKSTGRLVLAVATAMLFAIIVATFVLVRRVPAQNEPLELSSALPCQLESDKAERCSCDRSTTGTPIA